jgi:hypothetical protein
MKIEMGESLFYSWLRHVKECQIVQTNWTTSPQWTLQHTDELSALMAASDKLFWEKRGYHIYKKTGSVKQLLQQAECDALGVNLGAEGIQAYAVDVAFHEAGLCYGSREETVMAVVKKSLRTAMCLYGYLDLRQADIVFASPKINPAILSDLLPCYDYINEFFHEQGFDFTARIIANEDFDAAVLRPILLVSDGISDTNELFVRSYQMFRMFASDQTSRRKAAPAGESFCSDTAKELKIGKLAQVVLRRLLEEGRASDEEIRFMQTSDYSKQFFDLQFPLLVADGAEFDKIRYYTAPLMIRGKRYFLCSQWFETSANNDRPFLLRWIASHGRIPNETNAGGKE